MPAARLVACRIVLAGAASLIVLTPSPPDGTAQEFRLLVLLEALAPAPFAAFRRRLLLLAVHHRLLRTTVAPLLAILLAITVTVPISVAEPVLVAVAPEGPIMAVIALVAVTAALVPTLPLMLRTLVLMRRLMGLEVRLRLENLFDGLVVTVLVAELLTSVARLARALAVAVHALARLIELLAIGHDDANIMLGVLEIVLRKHRIAGRLSIAGEREILLRYMRRRAADFHLRAVGFKTPRKRILILAIVVAAAAATILLSLPHCLIGSHST